MIQFVEQSIVNNKEAYDIDAKQNIVFQNDF